VSAFEARYLAFLETVQHVRPALHRYCARMTGSILDGEDVAQEALFRAYRRLETFEEGRPMAPWLFRIAHNECIDFLRRSQTRRKAEAEASVPDVVAPAEPADPVVPRAIEHLVITLPPKERACVLLKDVLNYSIEEIAELVDSTEGGVKAALNRGRAKLEREPPGVGARPPGGKYRGHSRLVALYVERFNRHDWDGVRELTSADAQVRVADRFAGPLSTAPYFGVYDRRTLPWRLSAGTVDGMTVVIALRQSEGAWVPQSIIRIEESGDHIERITDYAHCPWILPTAASIVVSPLVSVTGSSATVP
jgi:RNA polymerase sigma-70 factor, ECF subfamily